MTKAADLANYVFDLHKDGRDDGLYRELLQWMEASPRFEAFVGTYRDKIRKKVRVAGSPESLLDVRAELTAAKALLRDRRFTLAYEPYASGKTRGTDFAVTYRTNLVFNVEVTRLRVDDADPDLNQKQEHILRILLDKLRQLKAGAPNLLIIHTRANLVNLIDLNRLMLALKQQVEAGDQSFFAAIRYENPAGFYKFFLRLSGILLAAAGEQTNLWINKQARPGMDDRIQHLVARLIRDRFTYL